MSDQDTIFSGNQPDTQANQANPEANQAQNHNDLSSDQLLSFVVDTEGRQKYNTIPDAMKGLAHSQSYIPQLEKQVSEKDSEIERLKAELAKAGTVQDFVNQLKPSEQQQSPQEAPVQTVQGLDADAANRLFEEKFSEMEKEKLRTSNQSAVISALTEKFGDKAEDSYKAKAAELGLPLDDFNRLSQTSPTAVLAYFKTQPASTGFEVAGGGSHVISGGEKEVTWGNHSESVLSGSTTKDLVVERHRVNDVVASIHESGKEVRDFCDPAVYFETFGKKRKVDG
jgi:hypothetical protein